MRLLVHVTAESGWPTLEVELPGRLVAQVWMVLGPPSETGDTKPAGDAPAVVRRSGLPPGLSFECDSVAEALVVIERESTGWPSLH